MQTGVGQLRKISRPRPRLKCTDRPNARFNAVPERLAVDTSNTQVAVGSLLTPVGMVPVTGVQADFT